MIEIENKNRPLIFKIPNVFYIILKLKKNVYQHSSTIFNVKDGYLLCGTIVTNV